MCMHCMYVYIALYIVHCTPLRMLQKMHGMLTGITKYVKNIYKIFEYCLYMYNTGARRQS